MRIPTRPLHRVPGLRQVPGRVGPIDRSRILFDSWRGRYSDSPRAIYEEIVRRDLPYRCAWVLDPEVPAPDGVDVVRPLSPAHLRALGHSGFMVSNNTMPPFFRKRPGTVYVQTWHGTPLKRIAFDVQTSGFDQDGVYRGLLERQVRTWDALISPNRFSTEIMRRAFRYSGEILETGYPRNDVLLSAAAPGIRHRTRRELGVPDGARAVLYAPTWRDDDSFSLRLDVHRMLEALGEDTFLVLRAHHLVSRTVAAQPHPRVIDASRHPDIAELYLAADVLVTDYSSVMFDFAVTGKPMIFFVYDLETYRDDVRGFYFDLAELAPGPVVTTSDDVTERLRRLDDERADHADAYAAFVARFCHLDDGGATARVVDAIFAR